jgi:glycosyltransferase involved in cell wall biosynthesis
MAKVSIIIPSRNEPYLQKTIQDLLQKARGEIEIYAILDGVWEDSEKIVFDPRVNYLFFPEARGMRNAINKGVELARGEYIMKTDAHCMFGEGYDEILKNDIEDNWVVVPRRYALDPEKWAIEERTDDKYPIDVMRLDENYQAVPTTERKDNSIIPTESFQGSCWFMKKSYYKRLKLLDEEKFGTFWHEAQEIGLKVAKDGGKIMCNTKTYYAHWHKTEGRGYSLGEDEKKARKTIEELKNENCN